MRKIPVTMTTQHPDHAHTPYWHRNPLIRTHSEAHESYLSFAEFGCDEHMWDWEGKLVDESVLERLLTNNHEFFQEHPLGKDKFLTFRLPNPKIETEFRLGRALMSILMNSSLAQQLGMPVPLFEVVLPMTETAEELIDIQAAYQELTTLKHPLYRLEKGALKHLEMIPLFEQVSVIMNSSEVLKKYLQLHQEKFGFLPEYVRPFIARSDPALNSGIVPIMLAAKIALSKYQDLEKETGVKMFPIIGVGALPFRGSLRPTDVDAFAKEYAGCKTVLIQSAFRYDYDKDLAVDAIKKLNQLMPKSKPGKVTPKEEKQLQEIITMFEEFYTATIPGIASMINKVAGFIPKRRERMQHIGLFGYSREVGSVKLPRAIGFTGSLYSLGVPPEVIGTGRGLAELKKSGNIKVLEKFYINVRADLEFVSRYVNKENVMKLAKNSSDWVGIAEDVAQIEEYLGHELGPVSEEHKQHCDFTSQIYQKLVAVENVTSLIEAAAMLRKSMG